MHEFKKKSSFQRTRLIKSEAFVCTAHGLQLGNSLASYFFWVYISMTRLLHLDSKSFISFQNGATSLKVGCNELDTMHQKDFGRFTTWI